MQGTLSSLVPGTREDEALCVGDGKVMQASLPLVGSLGHPPGMWLGRSFVHFIPPKDRKTFCARVTKELRDLLAEESMDQTHKEDVKATKTLFFRIRTYKGLTERKAHYMPFNLSLNHDQTCLLLMATAVVPASSSPVLVDIATSFTGFILKDMVGTNRSSSVHGEKLGDLEAPTWRSFRSERARSLYAAAREKHMVQTSVVRLEGRPGGFMLSLAELGLLSLAELGILSLSESGLLSSARLEAHRSPFSPGFPSSPRPHLVGLAGP